MFDDENIRLKISGLKSVNLDIPAEKYNTFEEMVQDYINKTQGVLTKIKINEKEIPLSYYDEIKDSFFEGGEEIELEFTSKKEVLFDLISQSLEYISKVRENLERVSKEVLLNTNEGHKMLNSIAEGLQALLNVIQQTRAFSDEAFYNPGDLDYVQNVVQDIIKSQSEQDYLELSDIIEFDFNEVLSTFETILKNAQKTLERKGV
ncbi:MULTISPECIES: hypothetical protein [Petrotoga]|uniref:Uncharacterized protein n=2 Tax=Petrotoga sibirica TaxID=156202 RepID=A0A4R8EVC1_9BACT|nr:MULTISPECIES: hypothetical protein [Petrotoga]POZ88198.1 hypothetical protein AA80_07425 [Petrotoga sibirica DSM 13575]POZ90313.1 hypothetical protein AD60_07400 [Petrotoga sp. SL27]TDX16376.1 hypothetical protein C8D74_10352 [Petrotoga sibirica]